MKSLIVESLDQARDESLADALPFFPRGACQVARLAHAALYQLRDHHELGGAELDLKEILVAECELPPRFGR
jgi:hypothetical protein